MTCFCGELWVRYCCLFFWTRTTVRSLATGMMVISRDACGMHKLCRNHRTVFDNRVADVMHS